MFKEGILASLFDIVKNYASVDIVSTSETEVSFTIDGKGIAHHELEEMIVKIREKFELFDDNHMEFVRYEENQGLIFCIGQNMKRNV